MVTRISSKYEIRGISNSFEDNPPNAPICLRQKRATHHSRMEQITAFVSFFVSKSTQWLWKITTEHALIKNQQWLTTDAAANPEMKLLTTITSSRARCLRHPIISSPRFSCWRVNKDINYTQAWNVYVSLKKRHEPDMMRPRFRPLQILPISSRMA